MSLDAVPIFNRLHNPQWPYPMGIGEQVGSWIERNCAASTVAAVDNIMNAPIKEEVRTSLTPW